jgi:tetratricopeptide (TPR) repeat protein
LSTAATIAGSAPAPGARRSPLPPIVVGVAFFAIYARGAAPTIFVGDSGDLATAVATMGIPHPSGYPLYVLLGKLWTLAVPFGSVAFRLGLFSAACAAAACALAYQIVRDLGAGWAAALAAALILAFAPSFWAEANIPRVYALSALFVLLALRCALQWGRQRYDRLLVAAAFLCALGASNHTLLAVVGLAIAVWAVAIEPGILRRGRLVLATALAVAAGLLPYLYLPIRAAAHPRLNWGNPRTVGAVLAVAVRRDFWSRAWLRGPADLVPIAADYVRSFAIEMTIAGTALALVGVVAAARNRRSMLALFGAILAGNLAVLALHGSRSDLFLWHRYYIPSCAIAALLAGLGADVLARRLPAWIHPVLLGPGLFLLVTGFAPHDRSRFRIAHDFTRLVFQSLPPGSHLIAEDDNILFALMYEHLAEGVRPDVDLILEGVGGADLPPLAFAPERDPVFLTHHPAWANPPLTAVPVGVLFRVWLAGRPHPPAVLPPPALEGEIDPRVPKDYLTRNLIGHFHYMLAITLEDSDWRRARAEFRKAEAASPDNDVLFYNLGLIYARDGLYEDAAAAFRRSNAINPRAIASRHPPPLASEQALLMETSLRDLERREHDFAADPELSSAPPESASWHRRMAAIWSERGDPTAARRHAIFAEEAANR